ncbi:hypothetical protein FQZ97_864970 [compost metagenome]
MLAHPLRVLAAEAVLDRLPHWRPLLQGLDEAADPDEVLAQVLLEPRAQALACLDVAADDDHLAVKTVVQLLVERQVEAHRAAPDVRAPAQHIGVVREECFEAIHLRPGREDGAVLRQVEVDQQFRPIRGGKELQLHQCHAEQRQQKQPQGQTDAPAPTPHGPVQQLFEAGSEPGSPLRHRTATDTQDPHPEHRCEEHGHQPGQ